jgi:MoaA/NifB/PqqE/SkfB family radical SAM enzyme
MGNRIKIIKKNGHLLTNYRTPTRRAVIWLGQTCNLNCYFCYFAERISDKNHPEHQFFSLAKAKEICNIFRKKYNLNSIDIQGGEPTIYPHIFELLDYCNGIGLKPSLITNAITLANANFCKKFKEHSVYDFLVSLQGIGDVYDKIVGLKGGFQMQLKALENLRQLGIPLRINAVLTNEIVEDLAAITRLAIEYNARVINFIGFNNSGDQKKLREKYQIPIYKLISDRLSSLIDTLEDNEIEVNLRFLPFCIFDEKYRKNIQNSKQMIYDLHEWEKMSRLWIDRPAQRQAKQITEEVPNAVNILIKKKINKFQFTDLVKSFIHSFKNYEYADCKDYQILIEKQLNNFIPSCPYLDGFSKLEHFYFEQSKTTIDKIKINKCNDCEINFICDGIHSDFVREYGTSGFEPIKIGETILDPKFYLNEQMKVVEEQEYDWAIPKGKRE